MKTKLAICMAVLLLGSAGVYGAEPKAVDIQVLDNESSVYVLYSDGYIQTTGFAVSLGYPTKIDAADLVMTPSGKGYYILETDGTLYTYGDAVEISNPMKDAKIPYVDMELFDANLSAYFLKQNGAVITTGNTPFFGETVRKDDAVDMEITTDGLGYYVLYEDGLIEFFGTAVNRGYTDTGRIRAVDLELTESGYYVVLEDGTILAFGDAVTMPFRSDPKNDVVDMILTVDGYRILTDDGQVHDFLRLDSQGRSRWFAQVSARSDTQQVTATPTRTSTPTHTPRPSVNYFDITQSGFSEKIVGKIPEGSVLPASLDSGYTSLFGGGLFIAAADGEEQPPRKILYYGLQEATGENFPGSVFASIVPERGSALVRGISYSKAGLYVVVQDDSGTYIVRIEGTFEESNIGAFSLY